MSMDDETDPMFWAVCHPEKPRQPIVSEIPSTRHAVIECDLENFKKYLEYNRMADLNELDDYKDLPIIIAAWLGKMDIVKYLVEKLKVDVNKTDGEGYTVIDKMIQSNMESFGLNPSFSFTRLSSDYLNSIANIVYLLDHGANVSEANFRFICKTPHQTLVSKVLHHPKVKAYDYASSIIKNPSARISEKVLDYLKPECAKYQILLFIAGLNRQEKLEQNKETYNKENHPHLPSEVYENLILPSIVELKDQDAGLTGVVEQQ